MLRKQRMMEEDVEGQAPPQMISASDVNRDRASVDAGLTFGRIGDDGNHECVELRGGDLSSIVWQHNTLFCLREQQTEESNHRYKKGNKTRFWTEWRRPTETESAGMVVVAVRLPNERKYKLKAIADSKGTNDGWRRFVVSALPFASTSRTDGSDVYVNFRGRTMSLQAMLDGLGDAAASVLSPSPPPRLSLKRQLADIDLANDDDDAPQPHKEAFHAGMREAYLREQAPVWKAEWEASHRATIEAEWNKGREKWLAEAKERSNTQFKLWKLEWLDANAIKTAEQRADWIAEYSESVRAEIRAEMSASFAAKVENLFKK